MPSDQPPRRPKATLKDLTIVGADVGISARGIEIDASNVRFHNVRQAWDVTESTGSITGSRVTGGVSSRTTVSRELNITTGWTPSAAPYLPMLCGTCGAISPSRHHQLRGLYFELWDNEEPCPKCGNPAKLSEGIFNLAKETVEVLKGSDITRASLSALSASWVDLRDGAKTPEAVVAEAIAVAPSLGRPLERAFKYGTNALVAMFAIIGGYCAMVQTYDFDPVKMGVDYLLEQLIPLMDQSNYKGGGLEEKPAREVKAGETDPPQGKSIPEPVPHELAPNDADKS